MSPQRVESNGEWSLFCPSEAPGLADTWGPEFEALYAKYEAEGRAKKVIRAQSLWFAIMDAQVKDVTEGNSNSQLIAHPSALKAYPASVAEG